MSTEIIKKVFEPFLANWPLILAFVAIVLVLKILSSARFKGWLGERLVNRGLARLDPTIYRTFHDLYIPRPDGQGSTQLDHIVASPFGIFVIETKNYRGWIFGSEKQRQWTQQIYRQKNRFQNPLHQNNLHVRALAECLDLPRDAFLSVIFFVGDAKFKTPMPTNVLNKGLVSWILRHEDVRIDATTIAKVHDSLQQIDRTTNRKAAARQHLIDLKSRNRD